MKEIIGRLAPDWWEIDGGLSSFLDECDGQITFPDNEAYWVIELETGEVISSWDYYNIRE